jgi:transposase
MRPAYVKPYVKRQKNDATDAEAICGAVTRRHLALCSIASFLASCTVAASRILNPSYQYGRQGVSAKYL